MPTKKHGKSNGNGTHGYREGTVVATVLANYDRLNKLLDQAGGESKDDQDRRAAWTDFKRAWSDQSMLEQKALAKALHEAGIDESQLTRFKLDHDIISLLIADLNFRPLDSRVAAIESGLLKDLIQKRSENFLESEDGLLGQARKAGVDFGDLERWRAEGGRAADRVRAPDLWIMNLNSKTEFDDMRTRGRERDEHGRFLPEHDDDHRSMRDTQYRERDDHGRFVSDDDDRRSRSSRAGSNYRDRDEYGRFVSDDDDHRYGMRSSRGRDYDDDRDDYRRSRSSRSDYDDRRRSGRPGGWYGDPERHSQAARRGWDDPDHGPSGWYGDRERHSEAARRGWDNPDHGPSGWYGDRERHSEAARRGWDNPDHGPSGWYGDSEGHSRASHRGWEDRQSSSRYDDDRPRSGYRRRYRD